MTANLPGGYTARYTCMGNVWIGEVVEWPQVITEGTDLGDCQECLHDALREMILASRQLGQSIPQPRP
jgi:predicted RNase H-like HicB family nuclease